MYRKKRENYILTRLKLRSNLCTQKNHIDEPSTCTSILCILLRKIPDAITTDDDIWRYLCHSVERLVTKEHRPTGDRLSLMACDYSNDHGSHKTCDSRCLFEHNRATCQNYLCVLYRTKYCFYPSNWINSFVYEKDAKYRSQRATIYMAEKRELAEWFIRQGFDTKSIIINDLCKNSNQILWLAQHGASIKELTPENHKWITTRWNSVQFSFLSGTHFRLGCASSMYRARRHWLFERHLLRTILEFIKFNGV